jgi:hypothetical protein
MQEDERFMMLNNDTSFVSDVDMAYKNKPLLSKDEIVKIVENSQRIEGYESASKEYEDTVEAFMLEHNVKVSA